MQDRLIATVADFLVENNQGERLAKATEEYRANLLQNVQDGIGLLPKLCTGVDVNVRFDSIRGFEYTEEIAVFDLFNIELVHGWLIDPQVCAFHLFCTSS